MENTTQKEKSHGYLNRFSEVASGIGQIGLFLMIAIIFVDVVGVKVFRKPIYGAGDIVGIIQLLAIPLAIPLALMEDIYPRVTVILDRLGARAKGILFKLHAVLGVILFSLLAVTTFFIAREYHASKELVGNFQFPIYPFIYITSFLFAIVAIVWLLKASSPAPSGETDRRDIV
jgi:TRAP-type C4-dicarboxylate transport system permease small subunit